MEVAFYLVIVVIVVYVSSGDTSPFMLTAMLYQSLCWQLFLGLCWKYLCHH